MSTIRGGRRKRRGHLSLSFPYLVRPKKGVKEKKEKKKGGRKKRMYPSYRLYLESWGEKERKKGPPHDLILSSLALKPKNETGRRGKKG